MFRFIIVWLLYFTVIVQDNFSWSFAVHIFCYAQASFPISVHHLKQSLGKCGIGSHAPVANLPVAKRNSFSASLRLSDCPPPVIQSLGGKRNTYHYYNNYSKRSLSVAQNGWYSGLPLLPVCWLVLDWSDERWACPLISRPQICSESKLYTSTQLKWLIIALLTCKRQKVTYEVSTPCTKPPHINPYMGSWKTITVFADFGWCTTWNDSRSLDRTVQANTSWGTCCTKLWEDKCTCT